jgi:N-acetyl sugar amidotransferase
MKYCQQCILPDTRPNLVIGDDGVCNACKSHKTKRDINWLKREESFHRVVENAKIHSQGYDCLIPVSGGKDSTWQVVKCLEYGLNPLAVTWKTPGRTSLGQSNLDNLVQLGVDHIDYQINPRVEKKFLYEALKRYGSSGIPMHMAMFNIPPKIALKFNIPLIIWGENSGFEYGSKNEELTGFALDSSWFKQFGVTHGTTAADWISDELCKKELTAYFGPSDMELEEKGIKAIFLGYYFKWDVERSLAVACEHGFQRRIEGPKTGYFDYADIDDDFISIHHYLKWYKFGFSRLFDNLSIEIRNGRMNRDEAIRIVREQRDQTPHEDIDKFCNFVGINRKQFFEICEGFRNKDIWFYENSKWKIKDFVTSDWKWE